MACLARSPQRQRSRHSSWKGWPTQEAAVHTNPATQNRTRDHLIAAAVYSQMLYQLSYSRSCPHVLQRVATTRDPTPIEHALAISWERCRGARIGSAASSRRARGVFPAHLWRTCHLSLDSESSDRGSNPRGIFCFSWACAWAQGAVAKSSKHLLASAWSGYGDEERGRKLRIPSTEV